MVANPESGAALAGVQDLFPAELSGWLQRGARLLDVREPWEYAQGRLPGAELLPMNDIPAGLQDLKGPLVIVCATGNRSAVVAQYLVEHGVRGGVANLLGGTAGWAREGREIER